MKKLCIPIFIVAVVAAINKTGYKDDTNNAFKETLRYDSLLPKNSVWTLKKMKYIIKWQKIELHYNNN